VSFGAPAFFYGANVDKKNLRALDIMFRIWICSALLTLTAVAFWTVRHELGEMVQFMAGK
jgi:hypothetical protein